MSFPASICDRQVFIGSLGTPLIWGKWSAPIGCSMVRILCVGGGAGGGGGTGTSGGGGGGSGAIVSWCGPAYLLPPDLYILPGNGGLGGVPTVDGAAGLRSFVSLLSNTTGSSLLLASGVANAGGGTAVGAAGAASTIATSSTGILAGIGLWSARVGQAGAGGTASVSALGVCCVTGGAGGGNVGGTGGNITGVSGMISTISGGAIGAHGQPGYNLLKPFLTTGGSGGGGITTGPAGNGGPGGYGSGGGGGGGVTSGATGSGGNGGPGIVIIEAW